MAKFGVNKYLFFGILAIAIIGGVYLNRAYAHIYDEIGAAGLPAVSPFGAVSNQGEETPNPMVYAALGDSLTAGAGANRPEESWPYLLAGKLAAAGSAVKLENFAVPGFRSADLVGGPLEAAVASQPDVVTVLIGANDIHNQVSEEEFEKNYRIILDSLKKETHARIYLVSIPFIGAGRLMLPPYQYYFDRRTKEFNIIIKNLALEYQLSYIDLYASTVDLFKKTGAHYSADSFHPSAAGYKLWADIIYDSINH